MKLHIMTGDDVRSKAATVEEIDEYIRDPSLQDSYRKLATVDFVDGEIVAKPLTAKAVEELGVTWLKDQRERLIGLLDQALKFHQAADSIKGVRRNEAFVIWQSSAPWAEDVLRDWADANELVVRDTPLPTRAESCWIRCLYVGRQYDALVRMQWDGRDVSDSETIARDAELDGRTVDAAVIRQASVAAETADMDQQEPF